MDFELPFVCDYAKSGRAICRGCSQKIVKGTLRIAIMLQSGTFDGTVPNWYHIQCFFIEHMPQSTSDISNFDSLKWDDQQLIQKIIDKGESPYGNASDVKKSIELAASKASVKNFSISNTPKFARSKCAHCNEKIALGELRVSNKTTKKLFWHHFDCFVEIHETIGYLECGSNLSNFEDLTEEEKYDIIAKLPGSKEEPKLDLNEPKATCSQNENIKNNLDIMHTYRRQLKENLKKNEISKLLKSNRQRVPAGMENILDRASDMLTFGAVSQCDRCYRGQLTYENGRYKCTNYLNTWIKCPGPSNNEPKRFAVEVPLELKLRHTFLNEYVYEERQCVTTNVKRIKKGPLLYKNFMVLSDGTNTDNKWRQRIEQLGGRVVYSVFRSVFAVIAPGGQEQIQKHGDVMKKAEEFDVYVVSTAFLDEILPYADLDAIAIKHSLSSWGVELHNRIPVQFRKRIIHRRGGNEEEEKKKRMRVKGGIAIEPDSRLERIAHVYREGDVVYNAVLSLTDLVRNKNSYYKIQLLESDVGEQYWLFNTWGRIGTSSGNSKVQSMDSLEEVKFQFKELFKKMSGNAWENRHCFIKKPGMYSWVDVNYQAQTEEIENLTVHIASSNLNPAVAHLMARIFNMAAMEKMMLEYQLDLSKMPLGKVSRRQITQAYQILNQIMWNIKSRHINGATIIEQSNQFYTLMPQSASFERPPLLDNVDIVQKKLEMLANLMEVETAYCMIQRSASENSENLLDAYYKELNTNIDILPEDTEEYKMVKEYAENTHAVTHGNYSLRIAQVFQVQRSGEREQYQPFSTLHNRRLLWHGSRTTNYAGILSQGLRIAPPEAPSNGYMFGKGVYFADMVSKSANYCGTSKSDSTGFVLLCEVALGNSKQKLHADFVKSLPKNYHSVQGMGRTAPDLNAMRTLTDGVQVPVGKPVTDVDASTSLLYNEYIVYDNAQINIKYMVQFDFIYKN